MKSNEFPVQTHRAPKRSHYSTTVVKLSGVPQKDNEVLDAGPHLAAVSSGRSNDDNLVATKKKRTSVRTTTTCRICACRRRPRMKHSSVVVWTTTLR